MTYLQHACTFTLPDGGHLSTTNSPVRSGDRCSIYLGNTVTPFIGKETIPYSGQSTYYFLDANATSPSCALPQTKQLLIVCTKIISTP